MSTHGAYGFRINNQDKVTYNHGDSYPSGLGADIVAFIKRNTLDHLRLIALGLRMVDEDNVPSADEREKYKAFCNMNVDNSTWYQLLREAQGDFEALENGLDVMIDREDFLTDSLFCEWAYIINLDDGVLEIYKGLNKDSNALGRYATYRSCENDDYVGVKLVNAIPLSEIQAAHLDIFTTKLLEELKQED